MGYPLPSYKNEWYGKRMPIPLKVRIATANCGNDGPGLDALQTIKQLIEREDLDCFILSGQEFNFPTFKSQFCQIFSGSQYHLIELGKMHTHTKPSQFFHKTTGIGAFIIAKGGMEIQPLETLKSRRSTKIHYSHPYNKGGLISKFTIIHEGKSYQYHHVSGHLDSNKPAKATYDWYKLINNYAHGRIMHWDELIAIIPDMLSTGMDANTRNVISEGAIINPWLEAHDNTKGMRIAPLGNHFFSGKNTYHSHLENTEETEDPKRRGFVQAGSLDVVGVLDPAKDASVFELNHDDCIIIPSNPTSSKRDHAIVISPAFPIIEVNDFNRVKRFLCAQLKNLSLGVSDLIRSFENSPQSRQQLIDCYNSYLSKSGLLAQIVKDHYQALGTPPSGMYKNQTKPLSSAQAGGAIF